MDKYIEMLSKIKENVHVERLLNESPSWIGIALIISMTVMGAGFVLMLGILSLQSSSSSSIVAKGVALVMSFIGVLATLGVFLYAVHISSGTLDSDVGIGSCNICFSTEQ